MAQTTRRRTTDPLTSARIAQMTPKKLLTRLGENWKPGLTVALVSLPLSISLAVASGSTPSAGIITAVWAGLAAALLGGSHFNIVGPAGALSGILAAFVLQNGMEQLPLLALATAVLILIAWAVKAERFLAFIPASTMHGFTLGVALTIGLNQLNAALGLQPKHVHAEFIQNVIESLRHAPYASVPTLTIFLVSLGLLFAAVKWLPKIPGAILITPPGILLGWLAANGHLHFFADVATLATKFGSISASLINFPTFAMPANGMAFFSAAIAVALVAILETMLTARIADGITHTRHNERREMLGLAAANMVSGLAGGLPATGVLVRTSLNAKSGATHRLSGIINALAVGVLAVVIFPLFRYMPMAVIAAILVFASIRMVEVHEFRRLWEMNRRSWVLAVLVAVVTVVWDPIVGIIFGVAASSLFFMEQLSRGQCELWVGGEDGAASCEVGEAEELVHTTKNNVLTYTIRGQLLFLNSRVHVQRFEDGLAEYPKIILNLKGLYYVDEDGVGALDEILDLCEQGGSTVVVSGISQTLSQNLARLAPHFRKVLDERRQYASIGEALSALS